MIFDISRLNLASGMTIIAGMNDVSASAPTALPAIEVDGSATEAMILAAIDSFWIDDFETLMVCSDPKASMFMEIGIFRDQFCPFMSSVVPGISLAKAAQEWSEIGSSHVTMHFELLQPDEPLLIQKLVLQWLAPGVKATSPVAMAMGACGIRRHKSYPVDAVDFQQCLLLLENLPEIRNHFRKIGEISSIWKRLVEQWEDIEKVFLEEAGLYWERASSAPRTDSALRNVRNQVMGVSGND
jgi:hypothetical protein